MRILDDISTALQQGLVKDVQELVATALTDGIDPQAILEQGLLAGMDVIGERFKNEEIYVPEVLIAARAMNKGTELLKPYLSATDAGAKGVAVIGTVQGDLHDIGKNLVRMMIEAKGITVIDLGVDVPPELYIQTAIENHAAVVCCSALLTTTMPGMRRVVEEAEKQGVRNHIKIMVGGAPVTQEFCDEIGADCYTPDAASAANAAQQLVI